MDRSTRRATGISIALHAVVLSGVLLIRAHVADAPDHAAIIEAVLLVDRDGGESPASAAGPLDEPAAPRSAEAEVNEVPAGSVERAADEPLADTAPAPAVEDSASEPRAVTDAVANAATNVEPEREQSADAALPSAQSPAAESATEPSSAPTATAADNVATEPPATDVSADAARALAAAAAVRPEAEHSEPVRTRERTMLSQRFASWTGELAPGETTPPRVAWKQHGQAYTAVLRQVPAGDATSVEHMIVDVSTQQGGKKMSTQLTMTRLSFSSFAQFVDRWNPEVQIHDDEIDGRFHSNTEIKLLSTAGVSPVFHGKVTLAAHDINADAGSFNRHRIFPEGLEMGVRRIGLPSRFLTFLNEAANGDAHVQRFERDARITFYEDGTYGWSYIRDGRAEERRTLTSPAHYLLGLAGTTLRIKGTVRGKVLVYAAERIVIDNDLRYAHARNAPDADDYLGLVAERAVEVAEPEVTGLGDLEVDASIYARHEFAVRGFRSRPSGTLRIFGSLTAGSLTATEPRFATKIEFDPRLQNARPPSFPLTDRYELESWDGEWRVEDAPASDARGDTADEDDAAADDGDRSAATARN